MNRYEREYEFGLDMGMTPRAAHERARILRDPKTLGVSVDFLARHPELWDVFEVREMTPPEEPEP